MLFAVTGRIRRTQLDEKSENRLTESDVRLKLIYKSLFKKFIIVFEVKFN